MEEKRREITPARMALIMEVSAWIAKQMTTRVWHLTFGEMDEVLDMLKREIDASRKENEKE